MSNAPDVAQQLFVSLTGHGVGCRSVAPGALDLVTPAADPAAAIRLVSRACRSAGGRVVTVVPRGRAALRCVCVWEPDTGPLATVRVDVPLPHTARARWGHGFRRVTQPAGLTVAFLGIDGAGKSTVIQQVLRELEPVFPRAAYFHFKPQAILSAAPDDPGGMKHPPGKAGGMSLLSVARLGYYLLDYAIGYVTKVWPLRLGAGLVVFDRHFYDLSIDPVRLLHRSTMALAGGLSRWLPRPDALIVFDLPAEVARQRKPQVPPLDEAARQRAEYIDLARRLPAAHVVDAAAPSDDVRRAVRRIILDRLAARTAARYGLEAASAADALALRQAG